MKLGRKPRGHDERIPKMATLRKTSAAPLPPIPASVDYTNGMPQYLGVMLNDILGDCTAAAAGHAIQVWSFNALGKLITPSDEDIESLYEVSGGYVPGDPSTDNGACEQVVLADWMSSPALLKNQLLAYVEIDVTDQTEVQRSTYECGIVYIGFDVPAYLMETSTDPGSVWDYDPNADNTIVGGHAVVIAGYDTEGNLKLNSWGNWYTMTPAFWNQFVDEAYALANPDWIKATGNTPAGLSVSSLESLMQELNMSPSTNPLVNAIFDLEVTPTALPSGNAAQASNSVVVTDANGTVYPAVVLTGAESTPWNWAATVAEGAGTAVVTALDANAKPIGTPLTTSFVVPNQVAPATYEAPTGIVVTLATSSPAAAARFKALKK